LHKILWIDIWALSAIMRYLSQNHRPPSQKTLYANHGGLLNQSLIEYGVDSFFASPIHSNRAIDIIIGRLRSAKLLEPSGKYIPSSQGEALLEKLSEEWDCWPLTAMVEDGAIVEAEYLPDGIL